MCQKHVIKSVYRHFEKVNFACEKVGERRRKYNERSIYQPTKKSQL